MLNEPRYIRETLDIWESCDYEDISREEAAAFLQRVWNNGDLAVLPGPIFELAMNYAENGLIGTIH